jgi:2-isopropylmalate synthase
MNPGRVDLYDTTLRDGTQREGLSLSVADKLRIARRLDALGVTFIEGGFPSSNPKDAEFFARAKDQPWAHATIVAFGSTRRAAGAVEDDAGLKGLLEAGTKVVTIFGKSSVLHARDVLGVPLDLNLRMIEDSVAYLVASGRRVIYDAEHFFDGLREDEAYALETIQAAARGGAEVIALCDTNGGSLPWQIEDALAKVRAAVKTTIGVHTHDDAGCAVSNALAAIRAGARHVQGTINGYGERCGNANLCTIAPALELKMGMRALPEGKLRELAEVSHFVAEVANITPDEHLPYVGRSAFAHKGGVHVAAMRKNPASYSHVEPELVGNKTRVVVSDLSGRGNVQSKAEELGIELEDCAGVLGEIKEREAQGFAYDAAEASVALMMRRRTNGYAPPFRLIDYKVMTLHRENGGASAEAVIKIDVGGEVLHTAAEGSGPVSALDAALRKALSPVYPQAARMKLVDYKVRILDGGDGTGATTRVLIDSTDGTRTWSTVGASTNIIEASWRALADGIEYGLATEST